MYIKNAECEVSKMEETVLLMKKDDNSLHVLNETASLVWEHIENRSVNDIVALIVSKYNNASVDMVLQDVMKTINTLIEKGLVFSC